jgi:RNA polymerase sigma-70 factor (ECF subfamily)
MSHDDQLVARMRQGDVEALARFVQARRAGLLAYIDRQLSAAMKRKVEPDDILQEVSAEAVRALGGVDLAERDPFGWLCQIAQRRIVDAHRRLFGAQKRDAGREVQLGSPGPSSSRASLLDLLVVSMTTPSEAFRRNQRESRLLEALSTLPEDQQEALRLRYVEALPSKEIAQKLGKSDGAVRVMLTRSLARLQRLLGEEDVEG